MAAFAEVQFADRRMQPVSANVTAEGWHSNGIDFADYKRMSTQQRKQSGERRLPTPRWAINDEMLRLLLVSFLEARLQHGYSNEGKGEHYGLIKFWRNLATQNVSLETRLEKAIHGLQGQRPSRFANLDSMCKEFVVADGPRKRQLSLQIESLDTYLRYTEKDAGVGILARIPVLYYRVGFDSVGVASELNLKPPHVRQVLFQLFLVARMLSFIDARFSENPVEGYKPWALPRNLYFRIRPCPDDYAPHVMYRNEKATLLERKNSLLMIRNARGESIWVESKNVTVTYLPVGDNPPKPIGGAPAVSKPRPDYGYEDYVAFCVKRGCSHLSLPEWQAEALLFIPTPSGARNSVNKPERKPYDKWVAAD